jgi:hypothetical protein
MLTLINHIKHAPPKRSQILDFFANVARARLLVGERVRIRLGAAKNLIGLRIVNISGSLVVRRHLNTRFCVALASPGHLHNKVGTTSCASFLENVVYVELYGSNGESQLLSDFLIGHADAHQKGNLALAAGERLRPLLARCG